MLKELERGEAEKGWNELMAVMEAVSLRESGFAAETMHSTLTEFKLLCSECHCACAALPVTSVSLSLARW